MNEDKIISEDNLAYKQNFVRLRLTYLSTLLHSDFVPVAKIASVFFYKGYAVKFLFSDLFYCRYNAVYYFELIFDVSTFRL